MPEDEPVQSAYAAGVIDGDSCHIAVTASGVEVSHPRAVLQFLRDTFGGSAEYRTEDGLYHWHLSDGQAADLFTHLLPFLLTNTKRQRVESTLAMLSARRAVM